MNFGNIIATIATFFICGITAWVVMRNVKKPSTGNEEILLNLAISPAPVKIKTKSKVSTPITEIVTIARTQLNAAIAVVALFGIGIGALGVVVILDATGHLCK